MQIFIIRVDYPCLNYKIFLCKTKLIHFRIICRITYITVHDMIYIVLYQIGIIQIQYIIRSRCKYYDIITSNGLQARNMSLLRYSVGKKVDLITPGRVSRCE